MRRFWAGLGWVFTSWKALAIVAAIVFIGGQIGFLRGLVGIAQPLFIVLLAVWVVRWSRQVMQGLLWRVRNRLLVSYTLIAALPLLLTLTLGSLGVITLATDVAGYLANDALDKRIENMSQFADSLAVEGAHGNLEKYAAVMEKMAPHLQVVVREGRATYSYPETMTLTAPEGLPNAGLLVSGRDFYVYAQREAEGRQVFVVTPVNAQVLSEMVPGLGLVQMVSDSKLAEVLAQGNNAASSPVQLNMNDGPVSAVVLPEKVKPRRQRLPELLAPTSVAQYRIPKANVFDVGLPPWLVKRTAWTWSDEPKEVTASLVIESRVSAVYQLISKQGAGGLSDLLPGVLTAVALFFLFLAAVAITIGVTLTRSITNAVHDLHGGTGRVMLGDFTHRITVGGKDQLSDLSRSFNKMSENLENLLSVAKEKERMQSELEIAREVQNQLFPRSIPVAGNLKLAALCDPARTVSGDYYDFQTIDGNRTAIAVGDVSGKGISAALLMATLQASFRSQLRLCMEAKLETAESSTAHFVSALNKHVYATTPPEKFATFFFAIYDHEQSTLTYTNAGHLPPILVRGNTVSRLEVNGLIVGAFPFAKYNETVLQMEPGDMLVCFTDGVSEPENEFGEMYGEDRLIDLMKQNQHRTDQEIMQVVHDAIEQWTGSKVLQDDLTLVIARHQ